VPAAAPATPATPEHPAVETPPAAVGATTPASEDPPAQKRTHRSAPSERHVVEPPREREGKGHGHGKKHEGKWGGVEIHFK